MPIHPFFFDSTMLLILPALAFAIWAQVKVKSTYAKFSEVGNRAGLTGAQVAKLVLQDASVDTTAEQGRVQPQGAVGIAPIGGHLTDHYDPRTRMLNLSQDVYYGQSVAALGIAAHEAGHAVQHAKMYSPLMMRNVIYPVANIGSTLAFPLFFAGLIFSWQPLLFVGIGLFTVAVFFTVVTLPVEFDASRRAMKALADGGYLIGEELSGARKVLTAAALTYVAAAAMAIMQLIRLVAIANRR